MIALLCLSVGIVMTVLTVLAFRSGSKHAARLVRISEIVGFTTIALGIILVVLGVAVAWAVDSTAGLTDADRSTMRGAAARAIVTNFAVFAVAAVPPLLVVRWARRRKPG